MCTLKSTLSEGIDTCTFSRLTESITGKLPPSKFFSGLGLGLRWGRGAMFLPPTQSYLNGQNWREAMFTTSVEELPRHRDKSSTYF